MGVVIDPATHSPGGNPHPQFILDYFDAYRAANPGNKLPALWARGNGWVEIDRASKRPSQIEAMTADLWSRARLAEIKATQHECLRCGLKYAEGAHFYDDTCNGCARKAGLEVPR